MLLKFLKYPKKSTKENTSFEIKRLQFSNIDGLWLVLGLHGWIFFYRYGYFIKAIFVWCCAIFFMAFFFYCAVLYCMWLCCIYYSGACLSCCTDLFVYLDDILKCSRSPEQHKAHLQQLFQHLQENGLVLSPTKCKFGVDAIDFLGHHISKEGVRPLAGKVEAIRAFPPPTNVKQMQEYLGMINFYNRFVPSAAAVQQPLTEVLKGKEKLISWTSRMEAAFV